MKIKKTALLFCIFLMCAGVVFAGGGQASKGAAASGGKETLVIGIQSHPLVTDYETNYLTQRLEAMHNINLDFYVLPEATADIRTKVSLMVSSQDLPDLIFTGGSLTDEQILDYGSKGAFLPLNKYYSDPAKMPNFAAIPADEKEVIFNTCTSADGNIYILPRYELETRNLTPFWLFYNAAWAKKLGLDVPKTTDDLKKMLIAFRDGDPNGNGRKDELGLYSWVNGGFGEDTMTLLINCFVFYNKNNLALDASGNKVIAPFIDPAFRKGLAYLNDLFKEGVLVASSFTDDQTTYQSTVNIKPSVVGLTSAGMWNHWPDANNNPNFIELQMIPPLTGPDGVSWVPYTGYIPAKTSFVTTKAKNPDLAVKLADSFFSKEIGTIARYGEEDVDWTRKPEMTSKITNAYVEMGIYPAITIVDGIPPNNGVWAERTNKMWHGSNPRWAWTGEAETKGLGNAPFDTNAKTSAFNPINWQHYKDRHPAHILPALRYNLEDAVNNAEVITNVNQYVQQSIAEFVTGIRDVNNDTAWSAYLRELNTMGLQQWITSAQATYDRQRTR